MRTPGSLHSALEISPGMPALTMLEITYSGS